MATPSTAQKSEPASVDTPLIEERVDTGLQKILDSYQSRYAPGGETPDVLENRFYLHVNEPIPELTHPYADAFVAHDDINLSRPMFAMVCHPDLPTRLDEVSLVEGVTQQHFMLPFSAGVIPLSSLKESRSVVFFERPSGEPLNLWAAKQTRLHDKKIIEQILEPVSRALITLREHKLHHGNIHAGNIFMGDVTILGESFSAPAGTLAHYLYEPLERLMVDPLGRGEATEKSDIYALAMTVYEIAFGFDRFKGMSRDEFIEKVMAQGSYPLLAGEKDFPLGLQDFFRGILNDNPSDRWGLDQLGQFLGGKHFNIIAPSAPKEAVRPVNFMQKDVFNRRLLAHLLQRNWRDALKEMRTLYLDRWCETSLHRPELSERMERAVRGCTTAGGSERIISDAMMKVFAILDPVGPLRTKSVSVRPDGIPLMLASMAKERTPERTQLLSMIDADIVSFWIEQNEPIRYLEILNANRLYKKAKPFLDSKALGFGFERVLYELNPNLCCQSPLIKPYHVLNLVDLLKTLDAIAPKYGAETSLLDRHIAAFIAAKLDISKELKLQDLSTVPELAQNQELVMMRLLSRAQHRHSKLRLVGLCAWSGLRIETLLDHIHNRVIRKRQKLKLKKLVQSGELKQVLSAIVNKEVVLRDADGFAHAVALYDVNYRRIEYFNTPMVLTHKAKRLGGKISIFISHVLCAFMLFRMISKVMGT